MQLGFKPASLRVLLTTGADLDCTLELVGGTYGTGTLSLVFGSGLTTTATMAATTARFLVDKAQADVIPDGDTVRLKFVDGTTDQVWALGQVTRCG